MERKEYYKQNLPHFQQPGQAYFVTWCLKDAVPKKALKRYTQQLEFLKSQLGAAGPADSDLPFSEDADRNQHHPGPADSDLPFSEDADRNQHHPGPADSDPPFIKDADRNRHHPGAASRTVGTDPLINKLRKEYYALRKKYIKAYNDLLDAEKHPKINLSKPENLVVIINTLNFWEGKRLQNHAFCIMPNHVHWVFQVFEKDENGEPVYLQDIMYSVKRFSAREINKLENREGKLWQKESFDTTIRNEKHLYYAVEYTLNNPVKAGFVNDWREWRGCWCAD